MAEECKNCVHKSNFKAVECGTCMVSYYDGVQQGLPTNYKARPMTNADRIRAMSYEELAEFITDKQKGWCTDIGREMYYQHNLEWLQQPAEGD